jgi:predicted ester cyclase
MREPESGRLVVMTEDLVLLARKWMERYADGDADGLLACLAEGWVLHEREGGLTTRADLAEITRSHADSFPEKEIEYLSEVAGGDWVAHYVRFTLVHSGRYHDLEPTGKRVGLWEMVFHRIAGGVIEESWRMTYPDGVYAVLVGDS